MDERPMQSGYSMGFPSLRGNAAFSTFLRGIFCRYFMQASALNAKTEQSRLQRYKSDNVNTPHGNIGPLDTVE